MTKAEEEQKMKTALSKSRLSALLSDLARAEVGYKAAISAMPYMPDEAKPYTQQTADRHFSDMRYLEEEIKREKGR